MLKFPYIRRTHRALYNSIRPYRVITNRLDRSTIVRRISQKINPSIKTTIDKVAFLFECQLPYFILLGAGIASSLALGAGLAASAGWIVPSVLFTIYDMINTSDIYPYDYLENMNLEVRKGKISKLIMDEDFIKEIYINFFKKECSNVIMTGFAGTGKTTVVEALTQFIESEKCPQVLKGRTVYRLKMDALNAQGASGMSSSLEMRILMILDALRSSAGSCILFIDEIHTVVDKNNKTSLANYLKPSITSSDINIIGATTEREYTDTICKDEGLKRRFTKIAMKKFEVEDCLKIIHTKYTEAELSFEIASHAIHEADKIHTEDARPFSVLSLIEDARVNRVDQSEPLTKKDIRSAVQRWHKNNSLSVKKQGDVVGEVSRVRTTLEKIRGLLTTKPKGVRPSRVRVAATQVLKLISKMQSGRFNTKLAYLN